MWQLIQPIDFFLLNLIHDYLSCPFCDVFFSFVTKLGDGDFIYIALPIALLFSKKHRVLGITLLLGCLAGSFFNAEILKPLFGRARPCWINPSVKLLIENPVDYSFPSGHTIVAFIMATIMTINHKKIGIFFFIMASLIAFSRLYLYVHFPSDVIAGMILGILLGIATHILIKSTFCTTICKHNFPLSNITKHPYY